MIPHRTVYAKWLPIFVKTAVQLLSLLLQHRIRVYIFFLIKHFMHLFIDSFLIRWRIVSSTSELSSSIVINSLCGNQSNKKNRRVPLIIYDWWCTVNWVRVILYSLNYYRCTSECFVTTKKATISRNETTYHHIIIIGIDETMKRRKQLVVSSERAKSLIWTMVRVWNEKRLQFNCNLIQCCSSLVTSSILHAR